MKIPACLARPSPSRFSPSQPSDNTTTGTGNFQAASPIVTGASTHANQGATPAAPAVSPGPVSAPESPTGVSGTNKPVPPSTLNLGVGQER